MRSIAILIAWLAAATAPVSALQIPGKVFFFVKHTPTYLRHGSTQKRGFFTNVTGIRADNLLT